MPCDSGAHAKWERYSAVTEPMVPSAEMVPIGIPCADEGGYIQVARSGSRVMILPWKEQMVISCHDSTLWLLMEIPAAGCATMLFPLVPVGGCGATGRLVVAIAGVVDPGLLMNPGGVTVKLKGGSQEGSDAAALSARAAAGGGKMGSSMRCFPKDRSNSVSSSLTVLSQSAKICLVTDTARR